MSGHWSDMPGLPERWAGDYVNQAVIGAGELIVRLNLPKETEGLEDAVEIIVDALTQYLADEPDDGVALIARERLRQVRDEGWDADHDDEHINGEIRDAAIAYAMHCDDSAGENAVMVWPWHESWWKPCGDPVRTLTKAGALIAAEIDRLQRKAARVPE